MRRINNKTLGLIIMIICCFFFQTTAYSLLSSSLTITGDAIARIRNNVRINDFRIHEVSDGVISSYEEFSKFTTNSNVTLPNSDSYIIYKLVIGNYENVEMQLSNITGLSSNLTYELIDFTLHDMICDTTNKCTSGAEKTIYLKIKYASYDSNNTNYNVNLNYEFSEFSNVLMIGSEFKNTIPTTATHLVFTDEKPAQGTVLTDVSAAKDMGVVGYLDGTTYKVSTRRTGYMPEANADSSYMFNGALLTNIDLDNLDISLTTNIIGMFQDCTSLLSINFGNDWDTSNITDMKYLFKNCSSLSTIDLLRFNTSKVTSFSEFFNGCSSLLSVDVSNLDTSSAKAIDRMFCGCSKLNNLDLSSFDTSKVITMQSMFESASDVSVLDLSNFNTENIKSYGIYGMFAGMTNLKTLNLGVFNTSQITHMDWMFNGCCNLETLDLSNFDTSNVVSMDGMFSGMHKLRNLDISNFNTVNVVSMKSMFEGLSSMSELTLSNFDTSNVISMDEMFYNCYNTEKIFIGSKWNTSNVSSSNNMFFKCINLPNYDSNYIDVTNAYVGEGGYLTSFIQNFSIEGVVYQFEYGMSWGDWIESKYNTDGFVSTSFETGEYDIVLNANRDSVYFEDKGGVYIIDLIQPNKDYYIHVEPDEEFIPIS